MTRELDNQTIMEAAQGHMASFEVLFRAYCGFVSNVAYRVLQNKEDAQEVVQEVFMSIHKNLKNFKFESSLKTWIYRITVNYSLNYLKKYAKQRFTRVDYSDWTQDESTPDQFEQTINKEYTEKVISSLLSHLNADQRACIVLRSMEGLSYQEIAEALQIPVNTVRTRLKRARQTLLALKKEVAQNEL